MLTDQKVTPPRTQAGSYKKTIKVTRVYTKMFLGTGG